MRIIEALGICLAFTILAGNLYSTLLLTEKALAYQNTANRVLAWLFLLKDDWDKDALLRQLLRVLGEELTYLSLNGTLVYGSRAGVGWVFVKIEYRDSTPVVTVIEYGVKI